MLPCGLLLIKVQAQSPWFWLVSNLGAQSEGSTLRECFLLHSAVMGSGFTLSLEVHVSFKAAKVTHAILSEKV